MSATVLPFQPFTYPPQLESIRDQVLNVLDDSNERRRIALCKGSSLQCHSSFCPSCVRGRAFKEKGRILEACQQVAPSRLKFGTFKTRDVALDALRETGQIIMETGRRVFERLGVDGYVARLETSFEDWSDLYHPHGHAIIDSPSGGRGFIPRQVWEDEWLGALPSDLHPLEQGAHVTPVRDLVASAAYMTKSQFLEHSAARTVAAIRELKGVRKLNRGGSLKDRVAAQCAA
jgi:hypothetical protein